MKREELKSTKLYARFATEVYDDFGESLFEQEYYRKEHADSVMDAYEARIQELEMERDNAMQLEQEWKETSDNNHKAYVDYFHLCEKQSERIKELEAQLENVQNTMYTENVDANMALVKANARIKELEAENARLKAQVPVWHSVADGNLPKDEDTDDGGFVLVDIHEMEDFPIPGTERVRVGEMYYENLAYDNENDCGIFVNMEHSTPNFDKCWFTHWMPLPPPPTTEESSATEKENG